MKKLFPLLVVAVAVLLIFAGVAGAAITEEPLVLKEGEVGITSVANEPVEQVVDPNAAGGTKEEVVPEERVEVVGEGIEGEFVITNLDDSEDAVDGRGEVQENYRSEIAEMNILSTPQPTNYLPYTIGGAFLLALAAFVIRKKTAVAK